MSSPIVAIETGNDYQRLILWKYINKMLRADGNIECIQYEYDEVKSFDDIVIRYIEPKEYKGISNVKKEYIQVKYHVKTRGLMTWSNLLNPKYINASKYSLMDRLKDAYLENKENYNEFVFVLYTTDEICQNDTLFKYRENRDGFIDVDKFFDDTKITDRAKDIKLLMDKLGLCREELKECLSRFRIIKGKIIIEITEDLNIQFMKNGLRTINEHSSINPYLDLAKKWLRGGTTKIENEFVFLECEREDLIMPENEEESFNIAIKTFEKNTEYLNREDIRILDLSEHFIQGRFLCKDKDWAEHIYSKIYTFCEENIDVKTIYRLHLESNLTTSFLTGRICDSTSGYRIVPVQKTQDGMKPWRYDDCDFRNIDDLISIDISDKSNNAMNDIIILSITADIEEDVKDSVKDNISIRNIMNIKSKEITNNCISNGREAWEIVNYIYNQIKKNRFGKNGIIHIYAACPNVLMYYLGKISKTLGRIVLYEYDLFSLENGSYLISAIFPMKGEF